MMGAQVQNMPCGRWPDIGPVRGCFENLTILYYNRLCTREQVKNSAKKTLNFRDRCRSDKKLAKSASIAYNRAKQKSHFCPEGTKMSAK